MSYLKLFRDEPETLAPEPLPFEPIKRAWMSTRADHHDSGDRPMESITQVEQALSQVERNLETLAGQVEECCEPIRMSDWLDAQDDGPWAA